MKTFLDVLAVIWLVVWKTAANFLASLQLLLYLACGWVDEDTMSSLILEQLDEGAGWAEIRIFLWWNSAWAVELLAHHERRKLLRDSGAWR